MGGGASRSGTCRWPGVPPMFEFKDPDGNRYEIIKANA